MNNLRIILASIALVFCGYVVAMNWWVFVQNHIVKKKWSSCIPLLGGIGGCVGLCLLPIPGIWKFSWIPLIVDWGSVPVLVTAWICHYKERQ